MNEIEVTTPMEEIDKLEMQLAEMRQLYLDSQKELEETQEDLSQTIAAEAELTTKIEALHKDMTRLEKRVAQSDALLTALGHLVRGYFS